MLNAMRDYFDRLLNVWSSTLNSLPKAPLQQGVDLEAIGASVDEDGLVTWKPTLMVSPIDLSNVEQEAGVKLHDSLHQYFGSYWFLALGGAFFDRKIQLESVVPGIQDHDFWVQVKRYKEAHGGRLEHIPIGIESSQSLLVVVNNATGEVLLEDFESDGFEPLAPSLEDLVRNLMV